MLFWFLPLLSLGTLAAYCLWNLKLCRACDAKLAEGGALVQVARYRQAVDAFEEGFALASRILMGQGDRAILCALGAAEALQQAGQKANAYDSALAAFMISGRQARAAYSLRLYTLLADLSEEHGHSPRAIGMRQVVVALLQSSCPNSKELSLQLRKLGASLSFGGLPVHAAIAYEEATQLLWRRVQDSPEDNADYAQALLQLGTVLGKLGQFQRAEDALQSARRIVPAKAHSAPVLRELGTLYCAWSRYAEACTFFEDAYRVQVRASGPSDVQVALILTGYAECLRKIGRVDAARNTATRAVKLLEVNQHPALASGLGTLGSVLLADREYTQAVEVFERADRAASVCRSSPLETAERLESHAQALEALHRALDAEQLREGASSIRSALAAAPPADELFTANLQSVTPAANWADGG